MNEESGSEEIEQQAAEWLALRDERDLTLAEKSEFETWIKADPRHAAAVAELALAWGELDRLGGYPRPEGAAADPDFFARPKHFRLSLLAGTALVAAAVLAAAALLWHRLPKAGAEGAPTPVLAAAAAGTIRDLQLPDRSQVTLNGGSELVEQFTAGERRIRLLRGEADFAVTHNPARPFIVQAGPVAVRAVGTAFDVRIRPDAIDVLVTEGRVRLDTATKGRPEAVLFVGAGEKVAIPLTSNGALLPEKAEPIDPRAMGKALAWETGRWFVFNATPLSEVVEQFNRYSPHRLRLMDPELGSLRISGTFRGDDEESFLQLLGPGFGVVCQTAADGEIHLLKAPGDGTGPSVDR